MSSATGHWLASGLLLSGAGKISWHICSTTWLACSCSGVILMPSTMIVLTRTKTEETSKTNSLHLFSNSIGTRLWRGPLWKPAVLSFSTTFSSDLLPAKDTDHVAALPKIWVNTTVTKVTCTGPPKSTVWFCCFWPLNTSSRSNVLSTSFDSPWSPKDKEDLGLNTSPSVLRCKTK